MKIKPNQKRSSIYIKSLNIRNLRTLKGEVNLDFTKPDGTLPQWTLILGDNGIGKSTLLQCVAWMKPYLPDASGKGMEIGKDDIEPTINNQDNESLERLVRNDIDLDKESTFIQGNFIAGRELNTNKSSKKENWCLSNMEIHLDREHKLKEVEHHFDTDAENIFLKNEIFMFAYSASRILGKANITDPNVDDSLTSFLEDETVLYDAEEILHTINYAALGSKKDEKLKYTTYLNNVKQALVSILPDFETVKDIEISAPKFVDKLIKPGEVFITTKHGFKLPFKDFSLGYKTVMSWVIDLSWRLFNAFPESTQPFHEPAIVIVDEIDLHLHPIWQREIIRHLSQHFPKIQFIATAHSPLMVQAALEENYAILKFVDGSVAVINEPKAVDGWRVDQILTSEFFGLKTARGLEYEEMLNERQLLLRKRKLKKEERQKLDELTEKLSKYPTGESDEEIENRKVISDVVEKLKQQKVAIEI
jgi:predicted ATP-binding protein involved in virulence